MIATRLRALLAEVLVRWQHGGELPRSADDEAQPHWYELPYWC